MLKYRKMIAGRLQASEQQQPHLRHESYGPFKPERLQPLLPFASAMALLPERCVYVFFVCVCVCCDARSSAFVCMPYCMSGRVWVGICNVHSSTHDVMLSAPQLVHVATAGLIVPCFLCGALCVAYCAAECAQFHRLPKS